MKEKEDLRIRKTRTILHKSLFQILKKTPYEKIKIKDICSLANINRSTFYDHFKDKEELLFSSLEDSKIELKEELDKVKVTSNLKEYYINLSIVLLEYIYKKKSIYHTISQIKNSSSIMHDTISSSLLETLTKHLNDYETKNSIPIETINIFYGNAIAAIIEKAIKENKNQEELSIMLKQLFPDFNYITKKK